MGGAINEINCALLNIKYNIKKTKGALASRIDPCRLPRHACMPICAIYNADFFILLYYI